MNWQWPSTRAIASSMVLPSRRRWAATSIKGIGLLSIRTCLFMKWRLDAILTGHQTRRALGRQLRRRLLQAAGGDFEAGDAFLAGDGRRGAVADRGDECLQFRAQRLRMAD